MQSKPTRNECLEPFLKLKELVLIMSNHKPVELFKQIYLCIYVLQGNTGGLMKYFTDCVISSCNITLMR